MITLWRIMIGGSRNFLRNAWLSTAATAVMTVTLTIILVSYISNLALTSTLKGVVNKIDVSIYLNDNVTKDQVKSLQTRLLKLDNILAVKFVSKDEALAAYKLQNIGNKALLDSITELGSNPLPQSLQIKAKNPNKLDSIVSFFNQDDTKTMLQEKNPISYSGERKKAIDRIIGFINFMRKTGLTLSLVFVIISTLIIFNTIRMAIFTRRDEIEIMKLVGATNWYIRGPFLFEAALYGIIAAVVAVALGYSLILAGGPKLSNYIDVVSTVQLFKAYPVLIIGGELVLGVFIGISSSLLAMVRYLSL